MTNRFIKYYAIIVSLLVITGGIVLYKLLPDVSPPTVNKYMAEWEAPEIAQLPNTPEAAIIRYGKELIINTSKYFGPKATIAKMSNGMNCANCHLDGGTRAYGNCFATVASTYPKFRPRSGKIESIEYRINDCFERSLNGKTLDSLSKEMIAMLAYIKWLGKDVPKNTTPKGSGIPELSLMQRAANADNGKNIFVSKCQRCHGDGGQGLLNTDSSGYIYPPLWGEHSYNVSAGMYRLSRLAGFVKYNMPYNALYSIPELTDEDAWDVAAYINSQQRPEKFFVYDWPDIKAKPFDYPFAPFADSFPAAQHKYGPFDVIKKAKRQGN